MSEEQWSYSKEHHIVRRVQNQSKSIALLVMHHIWLEKCLLTHEEKMLSEKLMGRNELV